MPATAAGIARYEREKAQRRQLQRQVLELRKAGYTYRQIAELQGCNIGTAMKRHKRAMAKEVPSELVEQVRGIELDRYDSLTQMNMNLLVRAYESGNIDDYCKLVDRINSVHDRRKKLVPIEVPTRLIVDQTIEHQTEQDRELADLLSGMAQDVEDKIRWLSENKQ